MKKAVYMGFLLVVASCSGPDARYHKQADTTATVTSTIQNDTSTAAAHTILPEKKKEAKSIATQEDDNEIIPPPKYNKTPLPTGIYRAVLPCNDCKEIEHTVVFYPDNTYRIEDKRIEKDSVQYDETSGDWQPTNGVIWLYKEQVVRARYTWKGDTLLYLDPSTKDSIALHKLTPATENETWRNKKNEGVTFFGVGNEPFWNIEIKKKDSITLHIANKGEAVRFLSETPVSTADSTVYQLQNDSTTLRVAIYPHFCSDGMSDYIYSHQVSVLYNGKTYKGCGILY